MLSGGFECRLMPASRWPGLSGSIMSYRTVAVILFLGCASEPLGCFFKIVIPIPSPRLIKSESLGVRPRGKHFVKASPVIAMGSQG